MGYIGCSIAIICEMAIVAKFSGASNQVGNGFRVLFLFAYVTVYGLCLDATCYMYCVEIFPPPVRALGMGLSVSTQACATLVYTQAAPVAFGNVGWRYYFFPFLSLWLGFRLCGDPFRRPRVLRWRRSIMRSGIRLLCEWLISMPRCGLVSSSLSKVIWRCGCTSPPVEASQYRGLDFSVTCVL
jgi:hypothetical protein